MTDTIVDIPGVGHVAFPAGMSDADIAQAIKTKILPGADQSGARIDAAKEAGEKAGTGHGSVYAFLNGAGNGGLSGFGDEALAGGTAGALWLAHQLGLGNHRDASYSDMYDQILAAARGHDKQVSQESPYASAAGNIAGNVAMSAAALPAGATAMGPSLVGNALKFGATGAAMGGLQGFGEGEGGFTERLSNALPSAAFGAVGGAAAPIVGAGLRRLGETPLGRVVLEKGVSPAAQAIANLLERPTIAQSLSAAAPDGTPGVQGFFENIAQSTRNVPREGAIDRLATALQRSGMSSPQAERRLDQLGPDAMLADVNQQFMSEGRRARTLQGQTRDHAKTVLEARDARAPEAMVSALEGGSAPPSPYQIGQAFDENLRAVGSRAYGDMDAAGLKQSPELMALYENPYVDQALNHVMSVEKNARVGRPDAQPASPVEIMHKVKQAIWDMGFNKDTARPGPNASYFRDLGTDFMDKLKAANPALAEADRAYAQAASLPDFYNAGNSLLTGGSSEKAVQSSAPALADLLSGADSQQIAASRAGFINAGKDKALQGPDQTISLAKNLTTNRNTQAKIGELTTPDHAADIQRMAEALRTFRQTKNDIMGGSQTADKAAEALDTGNAALRVSPEGITPRFIQHLANLPDYLIKPNEAVRNEIGRMVLTPNAQQNREILKLAEELLRQRRAGAPIRGALAASAGAQIGRN